MVKKVVAAILSIFIIIAFCLGAQNMYLKSLIGVTYKYGESSEYLVNPYMGYAPNSDNISLCEASSLVYLNLYWSELEPLEGQTDWETIEKNHYLDKWREEGKNLVLRFVCDSPTEEEHMDIPQWLYDITGDGEFYDITYGKGYCPDYNNETFIEKHEAAIKNIADHFRGDSFLAYVELGSLGHWGEWHTYYQSGVPQMPLTTVRARYVQQYADNFDYCKLLMRRPFAELPDGAGVYNDMAGESHDTSIWLSWIENGGTYNETGEENALKAVPSIWNTAPVGGEFSSSTPISTMIIDDYDQTVELLLKSHMTFIGPKVPYLKRADAEFDEASKKITKYVGYRYRVSSLNVRRRMGQSRAELIVSLTNDGVAPVYFDFASYLYIEIPDSLRKENLNYQSDETYVTDDGRELIRYALSVNLKELLSGETAETTITVPPEILKTEGVKIYVGIENEETGEPAVYLDMDSKRDGYLSLLYSKD